MPFDESLNIDKQYFQITYSGDVLLKDRQQAKSKCIELNTTFGVKHFIVDSRAIQVDMDGVAFTKFAYSFSESEFLPGTKFALLFDGDNTFINFAKMIITVKGINMRGFPDKEQALAWFDE